MSEINKKIERLKTTLEKFAEELGFGSSSTDNELISPPLNALLRKINENRDTWKNRLDIYNKNPPSTKQKQIDNLVKKLRDNGYNITEEQQSRLYEAIGMPVEQPSKSRNTNTNTRERSCPVPDRPPNDFTGRVEELAKFKELLQQGQNTAITAVDGLGGIGKTALAMQLASELYHDGTFPVILWAKIGREPVPLALLSTWAVWADPNFTPPSNLSEDQLVLHVKALLENLIAEKCANARVLVVLDDVWGGPSLNAARLLLKARPDRSSLLITTRHYEVAKKLGATSDNTRTLNRLSLADSLAFLQKLLSEVPIEMLTELAKVLGGHPLALKLATSRLPRRDPATTLKKHLKEYQSETLTPGKFKDLHLEEGETRENNLELVLSYSYEDLPETARIQFRALGAIMHDQPFDLLMLSRLWQLSFEETVEAANYLCNASLLEPDETISTDFPTLKENENEEDKETTPNYWYRQHPLLHSYAHALLQQTDVEKIATQRNYQEAITDITEYFGKLSLETWNLLNPYLPHIHYVADYFVSITNLDKQPALVADEDYLRLIQRFAVNTNHYLHSRKEVQQNNCQERWPQLGLQISHQLQDAEGEIHFLDLLGSWQQLLGNNELAFKYFSQALLINQKIKNKHGEANSLKNIGGIFEYQSNYGKALDRYSEALDIYDQLGDIRDKATILNSTGRICLYIGDNERAYNCFIKALPIFEKFKDKQMVAAVLNNIGLNNQNLDDYVSAISYYNKALAIFNEIGDKQCQASTLSNIGTAQQLLGSYGLAMDYNKQVLSIRREIRDRKGEATTLQNMGFIQQYLEDSNTAINYYEQALSIFQDINDIRGQATVNSNIGEFYYNQGRLRESIKYIRKAIPLMQTSSHPSLSVTYQILVTLQGELAKRL